METPCWLSLYVSVCFCPYICLYIYISPIKTFECLNQSLWNLVPIECHLSPSQRRTSLSRSTIRNTNITACKTAQVKLYYSFNACTKLHETWYVYHVTWNTLNDAIHKSSPSVIPTLQHVKLLRQNYITALTPVPNFMKLGMYIMSPETLSTMQSINPSHQ
jgi:hypothetical protein